MFSIHNLGARSHHAHSIVVRQTSPQVQNAANNGLQTIQNVAANLTSQIMTANDLLHQYSDNSTDYAAVFRVNIVKEISSLMATVDKAFTEASATVASSNASALACITSQRNETQQLAIHLIQEVGKCGVTKVRQFVDLAINLELLGNETINLVPNTGVKIQRCQAQAPDFMKFACIGWTVAEGVVKGAQIGVGVSTTVATAGALYGTVQADLVLCAQAKLFSFRQTIVKIPVTIGICGVESLTG